MKKLLLVVFAVLAFAASNASAATDNSIDAYCKVGNSFSKWCVSELWQYEGGNWVQKATQTCTFDEGQRTFCHFAYTPNEWTYIYEYRPKPGEPKNLWLQ